MILWQALRRVIPPFDDLQWITSSALSAGKKAEGSVKLPAEQSRLCSVFCRIDLRMKSNYLLGERIVAKSSCCLFRCRGIFYLQHGDKQYSLHTRRKKEALLLLAAQYESYRQSFLNWQLACTYLAAGDPLTRKRTWQMVMDEIVESKSGSTKKRWRTAIKDRAFDSIRQRPLLETKAEHFWAILRDSKVSTNVYLRRLSNFALDMNWLPWPVMAKRQWPKVRYKNKRAITWNEHRAIVERERNPERKLFYQLAWYLGASQSDLAHLQAEDIDWKERVVCFQRMKLRERAGIWPQIHFGTEVRKILKRLPETVASTTLGFTR